MRLFFTFSFLACAALGLASQPPNILWITAEDMGPHLGAYGDPHAVTPHLDGLAQQGTVYQNAFATAPVCAPSRSALITGVYATSLGTHHMRSKGRLPDQIRCFPEYLRNAGYYCSNNAKKDYNFAEPPSTWDDSSASAHWRNRPNPDQPFFAVFNLRTSHESRIQDDSNYAAVAAGLSPEEVHSPKELPLPPYYPDTALVRRDWARYFDAITAMDKEAGQILRQLEEDGLAEETVVFFFSDHGAGLPRAKRFLYDSGLHVPLIVRIPERFRTGSTPSAGSVETRMVSLIDMAPTLLSLAGADLPSHFQGSPFLGPAAAPARDYVFAGRDRMDERYDMMRAVRSRRYKYIRNYEAWKPYAQPMATPERGGIMRELRRLQAAEALSPAAARFMAERKPGEELYDIENDPHELVNLAERPEHLLLMEEMRLQLKRWMRPNHDLGAIPEALLREAEDSSGKAAYTLAREGHFPPVADQLGVATLWETGAESLIAHWVQFVADSAVLRAWALDGLAILGPDAASLREEITPLLHDPSLTVRISAARALCRMGPPPPEALQVLRSGLTADNPWTRLQSVHVLDEIPQAAMALRTDLEEARADSNRYVVRVADHALARLPKP